MCSGFHHAGCSNYRPAYDRGYRNTPTRAALPVGVFLYVTPCRVKIMGSNHEECRSSNFYKYNS
jgi:hypothetical protein